MAEITQIETAPQIEAVRALVLEWTDIALAFDPGAKSGPAFAELESELAGLPGKFGPPDGAFLLLSVDGAPAGCGALKRFDDSTCELKRMYLRPAFRGQALGEQMVAALLGSARALGYRRIVLDSWHKLDAAHHLYRKAGFVDQEPWIELPEAYRGKVVFMALDL